MPKLNGAAKVAIPIAAVLSLVAGLHVLQQGDVAEVRATAVVNQTCIARVEERTEAQFAEVLRSLERIEAMLD